jgi:hypothetical protein
MASGIFSSHRSAACSGRGTDARWLIAAGLLIMTIMTAGNYWMSQLNLDISPGKPSGL